MLLLSNIRSVSVGPRFSARHLTGLPAHSMQKRPLADAASRNALNRFDAAMLKKYPTELEGFDEEAFAAEEREEIKELVAFVDAVYVDTLSRFQVCCITDTPQRGDGR